MRFLTLLLLALTACGQRQKAPPATDSVPVDTPVPDSEGVDTTEAPPMDEGDSLYHYQEHLDSAVSLGLRTTSLGASVALQTVVDTLAVTDTTAEGFVIIHRTERTVTTALADLPADTVVRPPPPPLYTGIAIGTQELWASYSDYVWGPGAFTASKNYTAAGGLVTMLNAARAKRHRLILTMTGGPHRDYLTNGRFDLGKWRQKMATFNTTAIKSAIATAVADGTIIGNGMVDEPEHSSWGGVFTKPLLNQMANEIHAVFPTLPVGVNHGPPAYKWRPTETYTSLDFVIYQYNWAVTKGDIVAWRTSVLARAQTDGVQPVFSINVLDGGVQDKDGTYNCTGPGQAGRGTYSPNCQMPAAMLTQYGQALIPYTCGSLQTWRFGDHVRQADVQQAFRELGLAAARLPRKACTRS